MEGVTSPEFRALLAAQGGIGLLCTEFVRISRAPLHPRAILRAVVKAPGLPLSVQVMGRDASKMAEAAGWVVDAGADVVDINLGCPMPRVVRQGVGAAMLRDPALLFEVVSAMRAKVPGLLSAKMRAGFDDAEDVLALGQLLVQAGVDFLTIHPRRRADFYEGVADWRIIGSLARELPIPIVGNGDIWYAADALRMRQQTGCAAVMIGRPALRNPWIFEQLADLEAGREPRRPDGEALLGWILERRAQLHATAPARSRVGRLKEQLGYLLRALPDGGALRREILRLPDEGAILARAERALRDLGADELDLDAQGSLALERSGSALHAPTRPRRAPPAPALATPPEPSPALAPSRGAQTLRLPIRLGDGSQVEAVLYRGDTLCLSTQVGCAVRCPFCASGVGGLRRSLALEELWAQVEAVRALGHRLRRLTLSGIGEPLHAHEACAAFVEEAARRGLPTSLTTSGGPIRGADASPRLASWLRLPHNGLTVSVHAGTEPIRARLVPQGPALGPLFALLDRELPRLSRSRRKKIALAYLLLQGENDSMAELEAFAARARRLDVAVHLYDHNAIASSAMRGAGRAGYEAAYAALKGWGLLVRMSSQARLEPVGGCGTLLAAPPGPEPFDPLPRAGVRLELPPPID